MSKKHQLYTEEYQDKKLIAFDLYGTCIHRPEWIFWKWFTISRELKKILETNPLNIENIEKGDLTINWVKVKLPKRTIIKVKKDIAGILLYPEFIDTIEYLKSKWYKTAVVSNLAKPYEEPLRHLIPEWTFDYEALSFKVWEVKPNPKIFEYIKDQSWINFNDIVLVWDSIHSDVLWAKEVWMKSVHINRKYKWLPENLEKHGCRYIQISTLNQLKDIL